MRAINVRPAAGRLAVRQELSAPIVAELEARMHETRSKISCHDTVAKAIAYLQNEWAGFTTFLVDGRICLLNNAAERELRALARDKKAWLFVGSDLGAQRARMMFSLFGAARLNGVDPLAWFTTVLTRIANIRQNRLDELLLWKWKAAQQQAAEELVTYPGTATSSRRLSDAYIVAIGEI